MARNGDVESFDTQTPRKHLVRSGRSGPDASGGGPQREVKLKLIILGNSAAYPGPDEACSGFLILQGQTRLLVDCGTGVLSNLQEFVALTEVSDIVISHIHADHFIDLIPYRYALRYGFGAKCNRPRLHLPPGGMKQIVSVAWPFSESNTFFTEVFEVCEYEIDTTINLGQLRIVFAPVHHYVPSYAMAISDKRKLVYSSDSGPCDELTQIASGADLLLCNAGARYGKKEEALWGHMTAHEAGSLAKEAGAKRLMLSHLWPTCDRQAMVEEATSAFASAVLLAQTCQSYDV